MKTLMIFFATAMCLGFVGCGSSRNSESSYDARQAERDRRAAELWYEMEMGKLEFYDDVNRMSTEAYGGMTFD